MATKNLVPATKQPQVLSDSLHPELNSVGQVGAMSSAHWKDSWWALSMDLRKIRKLAL